MTKTFGSWRSRIQKTGTLIALFIGLAPAGTFAQNTPFSLICMPDPQYYTTQPGYNLYSRQAQWIVNNQAVLNIKHVIWLGDLTNDNLSGQWQTAHQAYSILDNGNISYGVVPGNHDYKTRNSDAWAGANLRNLGYFNAVLGPGRFNTKSWYGGNMGETVDHNENNYTFFSANGLDFMAIGLEYAPRKEVLTWANNLISAHPNHRVIIYTHGYMTTNGNYVGNAGSAAGTVGATGAEIFDELASRHSNVFLVVCGHVTESVYNTKAGIGGNTLYEMLVDYQSEKVKGTGANLGNGWLRILRFDPGANKIYASTLTPAAGDTNIFLDGITKFYNGPYGKNATDVDHLFTLDYNMGPLPPYTYLNASLGFHSMSVGGDLYSDQQDPDIGQADNGNWASVWEDDKDVNGIYQIYVRGFDPDGNERFAKSVVNTTGVNTINAVNPSMAMMADGRFVVAWQSGSTQIRVRSYNADGTPTPAGEQVVASVTAPNAVATPDVAVDAAGRFVVTWSEDDNGDETYQVKARGFNLDGSQRFATKLVSTTPTGQQLNPVIGMSGTGDYVIVWETDSGGTWDIAMRGFTSIESQKFAQTLANSVTVGEQTSPDIAMNASGQFVVIWEDDNDLNTVYQIHARGFNPNGSEKFPYTTVNVNASGNQINPAVAMDPSGNWYPVWEDNGAGGQGYQIMGNTWTFDGTRMGAADTKMNPVSSVTHAFGTPARKSPVVSAHRSGRYIVGWADDMDGNGAWQPLTIGKAGTAKSLVIKSIDGTVAKSPNQPFFATNEQVTLTATPKPGHSFIRWTGDVPGGSQTATQITLTMNDNKKVTAEFTAAAGVGDWTLY